MSYEIDKYFIYISPESVTFGVHEFNGFIIIILYRYSCIIKTI